MKTKVYSQLEKLWAKYGAHEFGKICQILFGFSLFRIRFRIQIFQLSGRPDIVALRNNETFAFEVKTQSSSEASIKRGDLDGVKEYPEHAIIAVLSYPDLDCSWILAKAGAIKPGKWPVSFLRLHSMPLLEEELNKIFPEVLEEYFIIADHGMTVLYARFNEVWDLEKMKR